MAPFLTRDNTPFLLAAWGMIGLQLAGFRLGDQGELILLALAATAGLPHGALDILLLNRFQGGWRIGGTALYAALALLVVAAWFAFPAVALAVFLLIAWFHFGSSDGAGSPARLLEGIARGGAPLCLPAVAFSERLVELFAMLVPAADAQRLADLLHLGFWPWLAVWALALLALLQARQWSRGTELITLAALFGLVTPLVAFSIYFPLLHAFRSLGAVRGMVPQAGPLRLLWAGLWPSLPVVAAGLVWLAVSFGEGGGLERGVVQAIFVGLAAVTLPHVLLWLLAGRVALGRT